MFFLAGVFTPHPALRIDRHVFVALFFGVFALFLFNTFGIGCPKCGKRLGLMTNGLAHGLPGRHCTRCGADLTLRSPS